MDKLSALRHKQQIDQMAQLERSVVRALEQAVKYLDGKTTKTEVVNQLKSISTPDVDKVVLAIEKLGEPAAVDIAPLREVISKLKAADSVKVTNLKELEDKFDQAISAIKSIKLAPKAPIVNVPQPHVTVPKTDLTPLQDLLSELISAHKAQKIHIPTTDLSKVEKHTEETVKQLKKLNEKPMGGGSGGGTGTSFKDSTGALQYVELTAAGKIPVDGSIAFSDSGGTDRKALVDADRHVQADILSTVLPTASTATDVSLASAATSAQLLAANASRKGLLLTNTDANAVYVYYGTTATATKFTVIIQPNAYWEMPQPIYPGRIDAIWAANGSGSLIGSELS